MPSDGRYKGVAPGATLAIGKVLDDGGSGDTSQVIDGMEWAAHSGAKVVSMSLGACCSDGTDPAAQAVNTLTEQTGTLFVIAAGNNGGSETINSPAAADSALTVAAVDKNDLMAGFSSRGPRPGDGAAKPDIAGPGVDIVAARSSTGQIGTPVNDFYTSMSGTSMATPHVAGAAAILAQHHPDWTPAQIKTALMSTSKDDGFTVYDQGAGRIDLARADSQQVRATTPNVDFRNVTAEVTEPITKQVTYTNDGDTAVTLALTARLRTVKGTPVDSLRTADSSVTVPAHGTATTTVTLDPANLEFGQYTGALVGTDTAGVRVTVPIGLVRETQKYALTVHTIGRDGKPATPRSEDVIDVAGENGVFTGHVVTEEGTVVTRVPAGTYSVAQILPWRDEDRRLNWGWLLNPEVTVTGDTEITLDARTASEVEFTTPKPSAPIAHFYNSFYQRNTALGEQYLSFFGGIGGDRTWATPTQPVKVGKFRFSVNQVRIRPELAMSVGGSKGITLHPDYEFHSGEAMAPHYFGSAPDFRHFAGTRDLPLVDVGLGRPEDIEGLDLRGKLVLMETDMAQGAFGPVCGVQIERVEPIRAAGAAGVLATPATSTPCSIPLDTVQIPGTGPARPTSIPKVSISPREAATLRARLASSPVTVRVVGNPESPYSYTLSPYEEGRVPASLHYTYSSRQLAQVDMDLQNIPFPEGTDYTITLDIMKRDQRATNNLILTSPHFGMHHEEYVGPLASDVVYEKFVRATGHGTSEEVSSAPGPVARGPRAKYDRPVHLSQRWLIQPITPGAQPGDPTVASTLDRGPFSTACAVCRQGDYLWPNFYMASFSNGFMQTDNLANFPTADIEDASDFTFRLFQGDTEIPMTRFARNLLKGFALPAESGAYRLVADGPKTDVTWTFTSSRPTETTALPGVACAEKFLGLSNDPCQPGGILFAGYDLGDSLDRDNTVAAGKQHKFELDITQPQSAIPSTVAGAKLWASTDDGAHWTAVDLKRTSNGHYDAKVKYPDYAQTTGHVSLKVEAWDTAGNRIEQTSQNAFTLRNDRKPAAANIQ